MKSPLITRCLILIAACGFMVLVVGDAFGRAGGGGGYGGGGGGGTGGSGGGSDGGGEIIVWLIWLCIRHPYIGIPLLILIATLMFFGAKKGGNAHRSSVIRRGAVMNVGQRIKAIERLSANDPQFTEQQFYARVRDAFLKIQNAWCAQKLEPVRGFVSDGIYERFSLQILEQKDFGYRDHMEGISVDEVLLAEHVADDFFDAVTVKIAASAVDYRVSLEKQRRLSGSSGRESFVEFWTFIRRRGVKTTEKPGLIEGHCPNCGAEIELNQSAKCSSCDSLLRSGQYDWVLTEITQQCEWMPSKPHAIPGVAEYRAGRDQGFNVRHLEDRASVVFWRKVMADRIGKIDPLEKMASNEFCDAYTQRRLQFGGAERRFRGDCAVGSVDTLGVLAGNAYDRALVEIRWSGKAFLAGGDGPPKQTSEASLYRSMYVFGRKAGVKSDVSEAVSSAHCPGCGAPESQLVSHACEFCGEVLNDGRYDWVLLDIHHTSSPEAQALLCELRNLGTDEAVAVELEDQVPRGTELLAWAVKMALADGKIDEKEKKMLVKTAQKRGIPEAQLGWLINAAQHDQLQVPLPESRENGRKWSKSMARVSLMDGSLHPDEFKLLCDVGAKYDLAGHDVKLLVKQTRSEMYRQAKGQLRDNRGSGNSSQVP